MIPLLDGSAGVREPARLETCPTCPSRLDTSVWVVKRPIERHKGLILLAPH